MAVIPPQQSDSSGVVIVYRHFQMKTMVVRSLANAAQSGLFLVAGGGSNEMCTAVRLSRFGRLGR